jgi:hypothetical protein
VIPVVFREDVDATIAGRQGGWAGRLLSRALAQKRLSESESL